MTDLVAQYLDLVIVNGATPDDPRLDALLEVMSPEQVQQALERLAAAYVTTLPPAPPNAPPPPDVTDSVGLAIELVRRGARADDPRLTMLLGAMTPDELQRGRQAIGELWLAQLIAGPPN